MGIPESKRDRVFSRFDKLDSFAQGTGLGLSIVKALSEQSGGKCGFDSIEGKGSYFWSWKPFPDIRFSVSEKKTEEKRTLIGENKFTLDIKKILIAEDNESNFILTRSILKGYDISWATNGADAVEKAAKGNYDVILMDIKMPIMNGLDATREIRKFNPDIPIIAVTANAFPADEEMTLEAGCTSFLPKPIKKAELMKALASCRKSTRG